MNDKKLDFNENVVSDEYNQALQKILKELEDYLEVPIVLNVLLGERMISIRELLDLETGSLVNLFRSAGDSLLLYLNKSYFGKGEVTILEDTLGVRITEINDPREV
jgi:flagellar motor switch protein FliN/FliY